MKNTLITLMAFFIFHSPLSANDKMDAAPLPLINISKEDILKSIEALRKQGKITEAELEVAKKELSGLSDSQIKSITDIAIDIIKKDPDKALELMNSKKVDVNELNKLKKQIESSNQIP